MKRAWLLFLPVFAVHASVLVTDYGAKGNGSNDAPAFQAALNSGQEVHVPPGSYTIRGTITMPAGSTLVGENNPTLLAGPGPAIAFTTSGAWVTVRGFTIDGQNQGGDVFNWYNAYNIRISNCLLENAHQGFVQAAGACGDSWITDCFVSNMTGYAWNFSLGAGGGIWIKNCEVISCNNSGAMYFYDFGGITIDDFNEWYNGTSPKLSGWALQFYLCYDLTINNVVLDGLSSGGFYFQYCNDFNGSGDKSVGCAQNGFDFIGCWNGTLSNIVAYGNLGNGVVLSSCADLSFASCAFNNNAGWGLIGKGSATFSAITADNNGLGPSQ